MIKGKKILVISPDDWSFLHVSKHHYALELAKNNDVYFLNPPSNASSWMVQGVTVLSSYKRIRGINKLPRSIGRQLMKFEVRSIISILGGKPDIVWSFDTSRLYFLKLFNASINVAHLVDFNQDMYLEELVSEADICFATSDSIKDRIARFNPKVYKINHGYVVPEVTSNESIQLSGKNQIKIGYIGNLSIPYLDWESIKLLVKDFSRVDFIFIGTISEEVKKKIGSILSFENFHLLPATSPNQVASHLELMDACIQIYDEENFPLQLQNPHKVMQYLGTGKPIFSSFTYEYDNLELMYMYKDKKRIVEEFRLFIQQLPKLGEGDQKQRRIQFAFDNTYEKQVSRIECFMKENLISF